MWNLVASLLTWSLRQANYLDKPVYSEVSEKRVISREREDGSLVETSHNKPQVYCSVVNMRKNAKVYHPSMTNVLFSLWVFYQAVTPILYAIAYAVLKVWGKCTCVSEFVPHIAKYGHPSIMQSRQARTWRTCCGVRAAFSLFEEVNVLGFQKGKKYILGMHIYVGNLYNPELWTTSIYSVQCMAPWKLIHPFSGPVMTCYLRGFSP